MIEEKRSFEVETDGVVKKYILEMLTAEQIKKADWHYSKMFNKALIDGVATKAEMFDILKKRNIYGPDFEDKLQDLQVQMALKIAEARNETEAAKKHKLAEEAENLRNEIYMWNLRLTGPLNNTCEEMADLARAEFITSMCVRDEKGVPVWKTYEDFLTEPNQGLALKARYNVLLLLQGVAADFLDNTPERQLMKQADEQTTSENAEAEAMKSLPAAVEEEDVVESKSEKKQRKKKAA